MDVVLGTFLLLFSLHGFCTFACGDLAGILHLHACNTLLSFRPFASSLPFHFHLQLSTSDVHFYFLSFVMNLSPGAGEEGDWMHGSIDAPRRYGFSR
jgi:hypothetical protein